MCSQCSLSSRVSHQCVVHIFLVSNTYYMLYPFLSPRFDRPNKIWWEQKYKSWKSALCYFLSIPLISLSLFALNIFLITLISNMCSVCLSLNVTDQVSHPSKNHPVTCSVLHFSPYGSKYHQERRDFLTNSDTHRPTFINSASCCIRLQTAIIFISILKLTIYLFKFKNLVRVPNIYYQWRSYYTQTYA
jgi:hypothetical protein